MKIAGAQVAFAEVEGGGALAFTAPAEQVPYLRVRVRAMAQKLNLMGLRPPPGEGRGMRRGCGGGPDGGPGHGQGCRCGGGPEGGPGHGQGCRCGGGPGAGGPPPGPPPDAGGPPPGPPPGGCRGGRGPHGPGPGAGPHGPPPPPHFVMVEETPDGARLLVLAGSPDDVAPLREHLQRRVEQMSERRGEPASPAAEETPAAE